jgi:hypothetical protein
MAHPELERLHAEARHARERYKLYKAKSYGGLRPTSVVRLRELERACESADARLRRAQQTNGREESG